MPLSLGRQQGGSNRADDDLRPGPALQVVGVDRSVHPAAATKRSMRYDPRLDHRRSIRLKGYDYSLPGDYFLTICTDRMRSLFGSAVEGHVHLNAAGTLVSEVWQNIPKRHAEVELDAFVLMPNDLHGIMRILAPTDHAGGCDRPSVIGIVRRFKSITTGMYRKTASSQGWPPLERRLWQRNYFDRVIRDRDELNNVRAYIDNNPMCRSLDQGGRGIAPRRRTEDPWR